MSAPRKNVHLVCAGRYHDFDFARLELLKLLAELEHVRTTVAPDYGDRTALARADALVTYTSDVIPDAAQLDELRAFLGRGGRWFALHGTNALLRYEKGRGWVAPTEQQAFFELLGSQFVAHPPIQPYAVTPVADDPLVAGVEAFEADDELYLCRLFGELEVLMETRFDGEAPGFAERDWRGSGPMPVLYRKPAAGGEVLYFTLGHARGHYDMQPLMDWYDHTERGSWKQPAFYEVLRRGLRWSLKEPEAVNGG